MEADYISRDPEIMSGAVCFRGTRVPVQNLFDYLEGSSSLEEFLEDFPSVSREAAIAVLEAAKVRLFADACCLTNPYPRRLGRALPAHTVKTAVEMGWGGVKNGALLVLAAAQFDALITVDKNLPYQQNLAALPVAVVLLSAHSNELQALLPLVPRVEEALAALRPRTLVQIGA